MRWPRAGHGPEPSFHILRALCLRMGWTLNLPVWGLGSEACEEEGTVVMMGIYIPVPDTLVVRTKGL